jgi:hypothetical protein
MNYSTLCDTLIKEAGLSDGGITSVLGQTGIKQKVVRWVSSAWVEIQNKRDWNFLWKEGSFDTVVGKQSYHPVQDLALDPPLRRWHPYTIIHSTSGGSNYYLKYVKWDNFDNTLSSEGRPTHFTIKPDNTLRFDRVPTEEDVVSFEYTREPEVLSASTDVPSLPTHHHDVILYQAMVYLAAEQDAPELYQDASRQLTTRLADMAAETLPNPSVANVPLA